jgi:predicted transcriptional regulator
MEQGLIVRQGLNWYGLSGWPELQQERRSNVDQFLRWMQTGPKTPTEVYAWWSGRVSQPSVTLTRLKARGLIRKEDGRYQLT